ncbi:ribonuclease R [Adhaeribacter pallidiroseus]|uniref:Ribonuclease R n=1 Tax=Adhaeribacter pallidiroseus TaxID=2072847 RepID=A0A369QS70_9BACT|nr:ribonuclease R [Adhaeribacter pallidiroseus]RDC65659.1 Ribonuclease [Adhaeribacter pallidiroseus]
MRNKEKTSPRGNSNRADKAGNTAKTRGKELTVTKSRLYKIFLSNPEQAFGYKQLSRRLGVNDKAGRDLINEYLKQLRKEDKLKILEGSNYVLNNTASYITGIVDLANPKYAYIVSDETEEDVRVFSEKLLFAMGGDRVKVRVYSSGSGDRQEGEVVEILERSKDEIVGRVELSKNFAFIIPDFRKLYFDVFVGEDDLLDSKNGDKVVVKITEWPTSSNKSPIGKIVRNFGPAGENEAEINSIMAEFGLPFEFPENVEKEAEIIPVAIPEEEIAKRRDFRNITTFTIDPLDAKDFDDALSIRQLENGHWEIGVHIADVTHYIQEKTALEREAYHRATSVYLVDRTIPMLPEKLSNGLCSLRPHEEKLTFSAVFELDETGKLYDQWIGKTIIYSDRRFTYEEAQQRIETGEGDFASEILTLNKIAHELKDKRFKNGAISFETVEVKFKLDEQGKPLSVYVKERKDAHKLIEEFMLLANRKVAEFVFNIKKTKVRNTMVYRTHDAPDPDKLTNFSMFAKRFGYNLTVDNIDKISDELNKLAVQTEGKPEQNVLQNLAIRTMAKAKYTTEPLGHFGLGFAHYSHFTSPIRRYPDMMAHRLIFHYLNSGKSENKEEYEEKCKYSSEMEKRAADAERASIKYKQVEFMQNTIGQQFKGIVSGVTEWGLYVEIQENKCEGMVRLSELEDDFYELDAQNYRIIGRRNKRIISFGDEVTVEVKGVNLNDRTIDLLLVTEQTEAKKATRSKKTDTTKTDASKKAKPDGYNLKDYYGFDD